MAKPKPDDKEQSERFIEKAREIEADESGKSFERAIGRVVPPTKVIPRNRAPSKKEQAQK